MADVGHLFNELAVLLVIKENSLQAQSHFLAIEEGVGFKIVFKTAKIDIGAATGGHRVVAYKKLGMVEARFVKVDFHARLNRFEHV